MTSLGHQLKAMMLFLCWPYGCWALVTCSGEKCGDLQGLGGREEGQHSRLAFMRQNKRKEKEAGTCRHLSVIAIGFRLFSPLFSPWNCQQTPTTFLLSAVSVYKILYHTHEIKTSLNIWVGNMSVSFFPVPWNRSHVSQHNNYKGEIQASIKMNSNEGPKLWESWGGGGGVLF